MQWSPLCSYGCAATNAVVYKVTLCINICTKGEKFVVTKFDDYKYKVMQLCLMRQAALVHACICSCTKYAGIRRLTQRMPPTELVPQTHMTCLCGLLQLVNWQFGTQYD